MIIYPQPIIRVTDDVRVEHHHAHAHLWHFGHYARMYYGPWA